MQQKGRRKGLTLISLAVTFRPALALATMSLAVMGLCANVAGVGLFLLPLNDRAATHPVTALCLFCIGFSLWQAKGFARASRLRQALLLGVAIVAAMRLSKAVFLADFELPDGSWFGPGAFWHGQFSVASAFALLSYAVAGLMRRSASWIGLGALMLGFLMVSITVVELSYGLVLFNGDVGAFTLLGLLSLNCLMVTMYLHMPFVRVLMQAGEIGNQTRVMAIAAIGIPWLCGAYLFRSTELGRDLDLSVAVGLTLVMWSMLNTQLITSARHEISDRARRRMEREIVEMSRTDSLTRALNRRGILAALEAAWLSTLKTGEKYGVLLLDLDHFKLINDTYGHDAGDDVLQRVVSVVRPHLRQTDALGRWGGEEFLIVLKIQDRSSLETVAERLRRALETVDSPLMRSVNGQSRVRVSASIGVSEMRVEDSGPATAVSRADDALYEAKAMGRNCVVPLYEARAA